MQRLLAFLLEIVHILWQKLAATPVRPTRLAAIKGLVSNGAASRLAEVTQKLLVLIFVIFPHALRVELVLVSLFFASDAWEFTLHDALPAGVTRKFFLHQFLHVLTVFRYLPLHLGSLSLHLRLRCVTFRAWRSFAKIASIVLQAFRAAATA